MYTLSFGSFKAFWFLSKISFSWSWNQFLFNDYDLMTGKWWRGDGAKREVQLMYKQNNLLTDTCQCNCGVAFWTELSVESLLSVIQGNTWYIFGNFDCRAHVVYSTVLNKMYILSTQPEHMFPHITCLKP